MWTAAAAAAPALLLLSTCFPGNEAQGEACFPHAAVDLVLLLEGFELAPPDEFSELKSFLCGLVDSFHVGRQQVRVGLSESDSLMQACVEFTLDAFDDPEEVKSSLEKLPKYCTSNGTLLDMEFLLFDQFTEEVGSRIGEGVPQVLVHVTYRRKNTAVRDLEHDFRLHGIQMFGVDILDSGEVLVGSVDSESSTLQFPDLRSSIENVGQALCELAEVPTLLVLPVCPQGVALDVIFLLDGSYTTNPQEFTRIKEFLYVLVDRFYVHPDQVRFGLLQCSERAAKSFQFYKNKEQLRRLIWNLKQIDGTKTMTGLGLDFLLNHQFNETAGSRMRQGVPQIAVLITGQRSSDAAEEKAEELKKRGIVLFAIGARDAALEELKEIASKPENAYFVSNFSNLRDITENIVRSLCDTAQDGGNLTVHLPPGLHDAGSHITLQRGRFLRILCHYDEQYRDHVKYWCRTRTRSSCATIVRSDAPETRGQVSIADDAAHNVLYVTMRFLRTMDSDVYWCGVETDDGGVHVASLKLTVRAGAVRLSACQNMLIGRTGDSLSIRSFYSEANKEHKKWCRMGDRSSCLTAEANGMSRGRVQLDMDDRRRIFTVTVTGLEHKDTGWYWIAAGDQHVPVHISAGPRITGYVLQRGYEFSYPLIMTLQMFDSQSPFSWSVREALHAAVHVATLLLYIICTVVAASKMRNSRRWFCRYRTQDSQDAKVARARKESF